MITKQLTSAGCPIWTGGAEHDSNDHAVRLFLGTSDGGGDQKRFRRIVHCQVEDMATTLFIDSDCWMHASQLTYRSALACNDSWLRRQSCSFKYFSTLAKIVHLWRDCAGKMFRAARDHLGNLEAVSFFRKLPARCVAGRWGTVSNTESELLQVGQARLGRVLEVVLGVRATDHDRHALQDADTGAALVPAGLDDPSIEETADYRRRLGKWSRDVLHAVGQGSFWLVLEITRAVHAGVDHHLRSMQKRLTKDVLERFGNHGAQLVCGKARTLLAEMEGAWEFDWGALISRYPCDIPPHETLALVAELCMHHAVFLQPEGREYVGAEGA